MLLNRYLKPRATPAVESVDPSVVDAVQQDVIAQVDNATAIPDATTTDVVVPTTDVPVETQLPAPNTDAVTEVLSQDAPAVVADSAPEVINPAAITVSVEDKETTEESEAPAETEKSEPTEATSEEPAAAAEKQPDAVEASDDAASAEGAVEDTAEADPAPAPAEEPVQATGEEPTEPTEPAESAESTESTETESAENVESAPDESTTTEAEVEAAPEDTQATEPESVDAGTEPTEQAAETTEPVAEDTPPESPESTAEGESTDAPPAETTEEITAAAAAEIDQTAAPVNQEELVQEINEQEDDYANQMLELNGMQDEESDLRAAVESLMQRSVALENFQSVLQSGLSNEEPISPEAAAIMGEVVDKQTEGLVDTTVVPAMESFLGRGGSLRAMSTSLEATATALDTVWRWIVAAIRRLIELGANLWRKFTEDSAKLMARAENLLELVQTIDGKPAKGNVDVTKMTISRLTVKGKPAGRSLPAAMENVHVVTDSIVFNVESDLAAKAQTFVAGISGIDLSDLDGTLPEIPNTISVGAYFSKTGRTEDDKMEIMTNARPLPGLMTVNFLIPTSAMRKGPRLEYWTTRTTISTVIEEGFDLEAGFSSDSSSYQLPLLTVNEMESTLEYVLKITKLINKYRSEAQRLDQIKQQMISAGTAFANKHAKETDESRQNAAKTIVRCINDFAKDLGSGSSQFSVYALRTCDHAMRYINACVQVYLAKTTEK